MRIISKQYDFYDGFCNSLGGDRVFVRKEYVIDIPKELRFRIPNPIWISNRGWSFRRIIFCGKIYTYVTSGTEKIYTFEESPFNNSRYKYRFHDAFDLVDVSDYCLEHKIVTAVYENHGLRCNTILKPHGFAKIMDLYTLYSELDMFISNMNNTTKEQNISDEHLITAKGFDRWTFRKKN